MELSKTRLTEIRREFVNHVFSQANVDKNGTGMIYDTEIKRFRGPGATAVRLTHPYISRRASEGGTNNTITTKREWRRGLSALFGRAIKDMAKLGKANRLEKAEFDQLPASTKSVIRWGIRYATK